MASSFPQVLAPTVNTRCTIIRYCGVTTSSANSAPRDCYGGVQLISSSEADGMIGEAVSGKVSYIQYQVFEGNGA